MEQPNYYAIIPAIVRYDEKLKANEKLLFGEITCLCNKDGYCYATNEYFSSLYNVSTRSITDWIKNLEKHKHIVCTIDTKRFKDGTVRKERKIYLNHIEENQQNHIEDFCENQVEENFAYNNTSNINIINNIYNSKNFKKPTLTDIENYINEKDYNMSAESFYDFYESNGWKVGKNPMKDWKAAVRNWNRNETNKKPKYNDGTFKVDRSRIINP